MFTKIYNVDELTNKAKALFVEERSMMRLDGWFLAKEIEYNAREKYKDLSLELKAAYILKEILTDIPLSISDNAVFAGTQRDAFARSYALINPSFKASEFSGYCDPTAVFNDIEPNGEFTKERIEVVRDYVRDTDYVKELSAVYAEAEDYTKEVAFFVEQVTGHLIPDFRYALKHGVRSLVAKIADKDTGTYKAMKIALEGVLILAERYASLAEGLKTNVAPKRAEELDLMINALRKAPENGASNLYEAIQLFILLWQVMCLEQAPNPFAFSVGNADRIFEPYRGDLDRETTAALLKHFLVFFNVGDRSWAISQNIIIGGKSNGGSDLTSETSYALLDAYYDMNLPQPILSVKLHKNTPDKLYEELGRFFFTPGMLTPSLFNDDSMFGTLKAAGVDESDLEDYSIAGCQEPLIMGKDNANTTNSWLNLAKILELTISGGVSTITGDKLVALEPCDIKNIRQEFYNNVDKITEAMANSANGASRALSNLRVPFLSAFMGALSQCGRLESGVDLRDTEKQGTKYNGSGCLIHGLSVIADSFIAIDKLLAERPQDSERLISALKNNFKGDEELRNYLLGCPKFGNNIPVVDDEAADIAGRVADIVSGKKNYLGNPFRPDFSSPSTHLLYGYWVGATPDGRQAREMLGYGVDPLYGEAGSGLGFRLLSNMRLPFIKMNGGYASHFGIDPKYFTSSSYEEKGLEFKSKVIKPLFFNDKNENTAPFYLYVNVTTPETLRKVLAEPKKYAPGGVYIMRIHGTFVNFLDLSPDIQQDIIKRLDLKSTRINP